MSEYRAPLQDIRFTLNQIAGLADLATLPGYEEATPDLVDQVLEEAAKLATGVIGPINRVGDQQGARLENGVVRTPAGFKEAYRKFVDGGWQGIPFDPEWGGQGLPWAVTTAVTEMWDTANTAFSLCPMLTMGAIDAIEHHGTPAQQATYLAKLVSGEWTGTMNLTEPHAGSDVGALRSRAVRDGDKFRIFGQKIFITYGDQDYTDNIVHLVLARIEGAPAGVKGISLFIVPKVLVNPDGSLGQRNDVRTVSLEHKLGIHASPTCVLQFGDSGEGAVGYLLGQENDGMACMFTMMNNARLNVGLLGLATAERAFQQARDYAKERTQGRDIATGQDNVPIIRHPDVRRMLMTMKAQTEAMRALLYYVSGNLDRAKRHADPAQRKHNQAVVDLLIPIAKAWCTDTGCAVTSTAVQVHGGMGFIEETGAAQHYRDARIHPIYEGTNGIQANDLMGRKILRDGGQTARAFIAHMWELDKPLSVAPGEDTKAVRGQLARSLAALTEAVNWLVATGKQDIRTAAGSAVPFLELFGNVVAGWLLAREALAAHSQLKAANGDAGFLETKVKTARFFADHFLARSNGLAETITRGGGTSMAVADEHF
ncbi:MAG: acyl-CoA dehydrogenase [Alphaproteobacteria bacterium]